MREFELIRHFFSEKSRGPGVREGVGDDAAILAPSPDHELVMSLDTLVAGVHFPEDMRAFDIGWRALAVNLSDLAAMGAEPRWCLLGLSLPAVDEPWLKAFCEGFYTLADRAGITLVGGDLVRAPLSITLQVTGEVPRGQALRRAGARAGERICIGGVPGEAAAGLVCWQAGRHDGRLAERLARPEPQLALGKQLRGQASACIDISDGLLADLGHLLHASGELGADIELNAIPISDALLDWEDAGHRQRAQLAGGDDYLLLFTLPSPVPVPDGSSVIGTVSNRPGIRVLDAQGVELDIEVTGYQHFDGER